MKVKKTSLSRAVFIITLSVSANSYGTIPQHAFDGDRLASSERIFQWDDGIFRRTAIMGETGSCEKLMNFGRQLLRWSSQLSPNALDASISPVCECKGSACGVELSDFFPKFFKTKMRTPPVVTCRGPNCYNAALIAAGFLTSDQFRHSTLSEFDYFVRNYCTEIHRTEAEMNDVLLVDGKHAAIYIAKNIAFEKEGEPKDTPYQLKDASEWLNSDLTQVFRCDSKRYRDSETQSTKQTFGLDIRNPSIKKEFWEYFREREMATQDPHLKDRLKNLKPRLQTLLNDVLNQRKILKPIRSIEKSLSDFVGNHANNPASKLENMLIELEALWYLHHLQAPEEYNDNLEPLTPIAHAIHGLMHLYRD